MRIIATWIKKEWMPTKQTLSIETETGVYTLTDDQLEKFLIEDGQMCERCGDTGTETFDEDDGEGHTMRGTGSRPCSCGRKVA